MDPIKRNHDRYKDWAPHILNRLEKFLRMGFETDQAEQLAWAPGLSVMKVEAMLARHATHTQVWKLLVD